VILASTVTLALALKSPPPLSPKETARAVKEWTAVHEAEVVSELAAFLAIPNVSSDLPNVRRSADALASMLTKRGLTPRLLTPKAGGAPAVFAEWTAPGATKTVAVYAHYDGQPVDPKEWASPPFSPVLFDRPREDAGSRALDLASAKPPYPPEARLYARGASDDKGAIVGILSAIDALRATGRAPSVNVKLLFEGEEEAGSPHLPDLLRENAALLAADLWLLCDGPVHQSRRMQVVFGARGVTDVEITLYGPSKALHSGHYGNWARNPARALAHLIASLHDEDGRIAVKGFDVDARPPTEAELRAVADVPDVDAPLRESLALAPPAKGVPVAASVLSPAINVRGLLAGHVGAGAANAVPTEARASLDFRLVPDQTPEKVRARMEAHLASLGYHVVSEAPDAATRRAHERLARLEWGAGYPPARTPLDSPAGRAVTSVLDAASDTKVLKVPTLGGSIPMYLFGDLLKAPVILVPIANHDNNQHAPNENIRLVNLADGIAVFAELFAHLGYALPPR
jgi:acetylornithine deacetylase/succinyl-diaminopimelate desuccinylase-like protein